MIQNTAFGDASVTMPMRVRRASGEVEHYIVKDGETVAMSPEEYLAARTFRVRDTSGDEWDALQFMGGDGEFDFISTGQAEDVLPAPLSEEKRGQTVSFVTISGVNYEIAPGTVVLISGDDRRLCHPKALAAQYEVI